jgi:copper chaperone
MACGACIAKISQSISSVDPQAKIVANSQTKVVEIESELSPMTLESAITDAGYTIGK